MPHFFVESGRPPALPPGQQRPAKVEHRPVAQVVIREIPRPNMVTSPCYMAVVAEVAIPGGQAFDIETFPGVPPLVVGTPILFVFSHCLGTCANTAMQQALNWGWNPQPHPGSIIPVAQALGAPMRPDEVPFQEFLDSVKIVLSGALEDINIPPFMRLVGRSGKPYIPCGTGISGGPTVGDGCPVGPCKLNKGGDCVWGTMNFKPERLEKIKQDTTEFRAEKKRRSEALHAGQQVAPGIPISVPSSRGERALAPAGGIPGQHMPPQAQHPGQPMPPQGWQPPQVQHPGQHMPPQGWQPPQAQHPGQPMPPQGWQPPQAQHPGQPMPPQGWQPPQAQHPGQPMPPQGWQPPQGQHPGQPMPQNNWGSQAGEWQPEVPQGEWDQAPAPVIPPIPVNAPQAPTHRFAPRAPANVEVQEAPPVPKAVAKKPAAKKPAAKKPAPKKAPAKSAKPSDA